MNDLVSNTQYEEKLKVRVGKMWVRSVTGEVQEDGQIHKITNIGLTADGEKAKIFRNWDGAKSICNKLSNGNKTSAWIESAAGRGTT